MHRTPRPALAAVTAAALAALTACGGTTSGAEPPSWSAPASSAAPESTGPSEAAPESSSPKPSPSKSGPKLVDADVSQFKRSAVIIGKPVELTTALDGGDPFVLTARPDGTVDLDATKLSESGRMMLKAAKVRKRTEENRNTVVIMAAPSVAGSGPDQCVTDVSQGELTMTECEPGARNQAWLMRPEGDFGLIELTGAHTTLRSENGKITSEGWPFYTAELEE